MSDIDARVLGATGGGAADGRAGTAEGLAGAVLAHHCHPRLPDGRGALFSEGDDGGRARSLSRLAPG